MQKQREDKEKYAKDLRYIQKRNVLADRYRYEHTGLFLHRERVVNFIEKMANRPMRQNDELDRSLAEINRNKSKRLNLSEYYM